MNWLQDRHMDQWFRIENPKLNPHIYSQLIFNKGAKEHTISLFNKQENWIPPCKSINLDPYLLPYIKMNSKSVKDLNLRPKTIKHLEETKRSFLTLVLAITPWVWHQKQGNTSSIDKWDSIKLETFFTGKEIITKVKSQFSELGKKFSNYISDKGYYWKYFFIKHQ